MTRILVSTLSLALAAAALLLTACGGDGDTEAKRDLTLEDLLAAGVTRQDIQDLLPKPDSWWPGLPEFNVGFDPAPVPIAGERFWVGQTFQQVDERSNGRLEAALTLFEDEEAAKQGLLDISDANDEGGDAADGPVVADEAHYFTRSMEDQPYETTLRFREDVVVGRITLFSEKDYEPTDTLAAFAERLVERIDALLAGDLRAEPLPGQIADLMPPAGATASVGSVFGSAAIPPDSWALIDSSGDPEGTREWLLEMGATELGFRRYGVGADPDQVVEVVLFVMADEKAAREWVEGFLEELVPDEALDAGETGELSGFIAWDGGATYELQFAKGRLVGDVACLSPFAETSSACEEPVRKLAELWYAHLPAE